MSPKILRLTEPSLEDLNPYCVERFLGDYSKRRQVLLNRAKRELVEDFSGDNLLVIILIRCCSLSSFTRKFIGSYEGLEQDSGFLSATVLVGMELASKNMEPFRDNLELGQQISVMKPNSDQGLLQHRVQCHGTTTELLLQYYDLDFSVL